MKNYTLPVVIGVGVGGLVVGVLVILVGSALFLTARQSTPDVEAPRPQPVANGLADRPITAETPHIEPEDETLRTRVRELEAETTRLQGELTKARAEAETGKTEHQRVQGRLAEAEAELARLRQPVAGPTVPISFGQWGELKELKDTDWKDVGSALQTMVPLLPAFGAAMRENKEPDPKLVKQMQDNNFKLVKVAVALKGKLPSHAKTVNGEYTHPVTLVNLLHAQLAAAGMPLTDAQKQRLTELGEEYEKRWAALQAGYDDSTLELRKLVDEVELKQWFVDEMFKVTTPEQKAVAVDPSVEGVISLDLYSPGLMLVQHIHPMRETEREKLKVAAKEGLAKELKVERALLDGIEFAFDDWLNACAPEPRTEAEINLLHTREVMRAGRAGVELLGHVVQALSGNAEATAAARKLNMVAVPQLQAP